MIILSLGSNLPSKFGDRFDNLIFALSLIESNGILINKKSSYYETPSYPDQKNPKFINIIVSVKTHLKPIDLMTLLISIEKKMGRKRDIKNEPRTCDIDIIDYNNEIINHKDKNLSLIIPHKELSLRNFVLYPLKEISPNWLHPINNVKIDILIQNLPDNLRNSILKVKKN